MSTAILEPPLVSSAQPTPRKWTADELLTMPDGNQFELVDGDLLETNMSLEASWITGEILRQLGNHVETHPLGRVFTEAASYRCFPDDPERIRKPDVSFIRHGRITQEQYERGHCRIAPDLAVEVVSPNDLVHDLSEKLEDYYSAGIPLIWVVEPARRVVTVHEHAGRRITQLRDNDELTGGDILPGFRCPLPKLFPQPKPVAQPSS